MYKIRINNVYDRRTKNNNNGNNLRRTNFIFLIYKSIANILLEKLWT